MGVKEQSALQDACTATKGGKETVFLSRFPTVPPNTPNDAATQYATT
jgi:hypothetical protein